MQQAVLEYHVELERKRGDDSEWTRDAIREYLNALGEHGWLLSILQLSVSRKELTVVMVRQKQVLRAENPIRPR